MKRISTDLRTLLAANDAEGDTMHFDAIVVGSGYGGGVSALRLAQSGRSVLVLERGREVLPGYYPDTPQEMAKEVQVTTATDGALKPLSNGLFDLRVHDDISVLVGCGLGGTSLINANVALAPVEQVFKSDGWPSAFYNKDELEEYFETARKELGATPLPSIYHPNKLKALEVSAEGFRLKAERPPINVTFEDRYDKETDIFQPACNMCGDCCSGCNYGSKNTTLMNYLPRAYAKRAAFVTEARVQVLKKGSTGESPWTVVVEDLHGLEAAAKKLKETADKTEKNGDKKALPKPPKFNLTADIVVLAAGSLGSTEILLRSKAEGLRTSEKLGHNFSGNGDVLGFGFDAFWNNTVNSAKDPQLPIYGNGAGANRPDVPEYQPGPTITGVIKVDMDEPDYKEGMVIQEGVTPGAVSVATSLGLFMQQALNSDFTRFPDVEERLRAAEAIGKLLTPGESAESGFGEIAKLPYQGVGAQTQVFLVMSHDKADGKLELNDKSGIVVKWPGVGEQANYHKVNKKLEAASDSIWANYLPNPLWRPRFGRKLITVHPIGGCPMGNSGDDGVVDHACRVFTGRGMDVHEGLYVCDGAVIPTSLGLNPLLTITAVSERAMAKLAEEKPFDDRRRAALRQPDVPKVQDKDDATKTEVGLLQSVVETLENWQRDIDAKEYRKVKNDLISKIKEKLPSDGPDTGRARILGRAKFKLLEAGLTEASLISDVRPALADVSAIVKSLKDFIEKEDYIGAASYLEKECGDYSPNFTFSEIMRGQVGTPRKQGLSPADLLSDEYHVAAKAGEADGSSLIATFKIEADSLKELAENDAHEARLAGNIVWTRSEGEEPETYVIDEQTGRFNLLVEDKGEVETWKMLYSCVAKSAEKSICFRGTKTLARRPGSNWWTDLTTLNVDLYDGNDDKGQCIAKGVLTLGLQDLLSQVSSFGFKFKDNEENITGSLGAAVLWGDLRRDLNDQAKRQALLRKLIASVAVTQYPELEKLISNYFLMKFGGFFALLVFRAYGEMLSYLYNFPGRAEVEGKVRPLPRLEGAKLRDLAIYSTSHWLPNNREKQIHLTRYDGRENKFTKNRTVVLAPGFATRAASFCMETVDENLVESLCGAGYDVWLLDYRSSPLLDSSLKPFTLDDVAKEDWPMAVDYIRKTADVHDMQAIVHCMGSMTHLMALLDGSDEQQRMKGIRSVISSQLSLHPVTNWFNKFKADTYMATLLRDGLPSNLLPLVDTVAPSKDVANLFRGLLTVNANALVDEDPQEKGKYLQDQIVNLLTWEVPFPNDAPCYSPTCHRIFGIYGPVFAHEQLNEETHNAIQTVFGEVSTRPFRHIAETLRQGIAVDADGKNCYLPNYERLRLPITFLAGALNQEFMPDTSLRTLNWLNEVNGAWGRKAYENWDGLEFYNRIVKQDYAHMDFFLGKNAHKDIYPDIIRELQRQDDLLRRTV